MVAPIIEEILKMYNLWGNYVTCDDDGGLSAETRYCMRTRRIGFENPVKGTELRRHGKISHNNLAIIGDQS